MKEYPMVRLVADEGKVLTNGTTQGTVVDVYPAENKSLWTEIDLPDDKENENDKTT